MATTKTAAAKAAAASEENKVTAVVQSIASSYEDVTKNFKGYSENLGQFGTVANESIRSSSQSRYGGAEVVSSYADRTVLCARLRITIRVVLHRWNNRRHPKPRADT